MKHKILLSFIFFLNFFLGSAHAQEHGALRICHGFSDPHTLDPHMHHNVENEDIIRQVYEQLIERAPDGALIPALATSWELTHDRSWRFKLRKGVKFHNGEEFNAESVKFSIERILNPLEKSPQRRWFESIDRVEILDDHTISIITNRIDVLLPSRFSSFYGKIVPPRYLKAVGNDAFAENPVGTGPFKFQSWTKGKNITLTPNKEYWGDASQLDKLIFIPVADSDAQLQMLKEAKLDLISNIKANSSLEIMKQPDLTLVKKPTMQYITFQLNTLRNSPLKDKRVRKALNHGVDVQKLIKYLYAGNSRRLATITMPEEFAFNPRLQPYPYDLKKAKSLLKEAGLANGFSITLLTFEDLEFIGKAVKNELSKLAVHAELKLITRGEYIRLITDKSIDFDAVIGNPTNPFFDASAHLDLFFNSKSVFSRYHNKEVDDLLNQANEVTDSKERGLLLMKIQEIIHEDVPNIFLFQNIKLYGLNKRVSGFVPYADGLLRFKNISLAN